MLRPPTVAAALAAHVVSDDALRRDHAPLLELVRGVLGVIPNCAPFLEIWPPGFRTYNVIVPNLLNLPAMLLSDPAHKIHVGLAMYASSRAAACAYCTAHCCAFALRRGAREEELVAVAGTSGGGLTEAQRRTVRVAEAMAYVPGTGVDSELREQFVADHGANADWIVLSVAMMGFLNKLMDSLGAELEDAVVNEGQRVLEEAGWSGGKHHVAPTKETHQRPAGSDRLGVVLALAPSAPFALMRDMRWMRGVPGGADKVGPWLNENVQFDAPVLRNVPFARARRAIATAIRDTLTGSEGRLEREHKLLAAAVFAGVVGNRALDAEARRRLADPERAEMVVSLCLPMERLDREAAVEEAFDLAVRRIGDARGAAAVLVARAVAPSPVALRPELIELATDTLGPANTIEILSWLSVLALLHRLSAYYEPAAALGVDSA